MPTIPISQMPDAELVRLIQAASTELARRIAGSATQEPATNEVARTLSKQEIALPSPDDRDFCLYVKSKLQSSGYVTADERMRVAEIALKHASWVRRQGLPTEHNTGPWRKAGQLLSAKRAIER